MLNSFMQVGFTLPRLYRYGDLSNNLSSIHAFINKMHGRTGYFHTISQRIAHCMGAWKSRQQRWMSVNDPTRKFLQKSFPQNTHEPGRNDNSRSMLFDGHRKRLVPFFTVVPGSIGNYFSRYPRGLRASNRRA
ncbi:Hypothetical protein CpE19_0649 [Corynebacterium pseudotuberculosis]|nr:Hypothetical protein CpE19_0649 [Corynebacterium pseudotuberculosis]